MKKKKEIETDNKDLKKQLEIEKNTKEAQKDTFLDYMPYIIIIIFVVLIRSFVATPVNVHGSSMYPTLEDNDVMVLYKLTKNIRGIKRFDIVVLDSDSGKLIKRVIGLPGDKIRYEVNDLGEDKLEAKLFINGKEVEEKFIKEEARINTCIYNTEICNGEFTVPEGQYYVMGDNRKVSKDSRVIGPVKKDEILGTTNFVLFPFDRFGKVN